MVNTNIGYECLCRSYYGRHGISNDCQPCEDDKNLFCGSTEAISIYSTGYLGKFRF